MKRTSCILLTLLVTAAWVRSGVLDPGLASKLSGMGPRDELSIIVHLKAQADLTQFRPGQKAAMVAELHRVAGETQPPFLTRFRGKLKNVGRFWIYNGLVCTATREEIKNIAARPEVAFVYENKSIDIVEEPPAFTPSPDSIVWSIRRVRADSVWKFRGYTGRGVVIGLIDTGMDITHPTFGNRWRQQDGWYDPVAGSPAPNDSNGHGIFCMGIAVGGTAGDTIGVAPGAAFIVAKGISGGGVMEYAWLDSCLQWFAHLDSLGRGASVVTCPARFPRTETHFWQGCRNLQLLGTVLAFTVGSMGPSGSSVQPPGNFPCLFGVGASDGSDVVASFSSRGPAPSGYPWDSSGAWLDPLWGTRQPTNHVKPDLVAPGVDIYSAHLNHGYVTMSGTSWASPQVAGAIALLLEKNPTLNPAQLWQIITSTCDTSVPRPLPNQNYGWGRLNCLRAVDATPSGAEGEMPAPYPQAAFRAVPNPFVGFTRIPGHPAKPFALFDISGSRVGTYRGDRVGEGLTAGVYFLRPVGKDAKPLRIIKLR